jgi:hypothetical protein
LSCVDRGLAGNEPIFKEYYQIPQGFISSELILEWKKPEYI